MLPPLSKQRWMNILPLRPRLVLLAKRLGAGDDAEDIAQEALLRAASHVDFDETRSQAFLLTVTARMTVDLHRHAARLRRVEMLMIGRPEVEGMEEEVADRAEARYAAQLVDDRLPQEIRAILRQRAEGITWQALATQHGESVRALETRVRRAVAVIRAQVRPEE